jgi:hypothetical protein
MSQVLANGFGARYWWQLWLFTFFYCEDWNLNFVNLAPETSVQAGLPLLYRSFQIVPYLISLLSENLPFPITLAEHV